MDKKIGFIGCGNMGSAMMGGILRAGKCEKKDMMAADCSREALTKIAELAVETTTDNTEIAAFADVLFLTVKPQYYEEVLTQIKDAVTPETLVVTVAPGKTTRWVEEKLSFDAKVVRTMPNTPAMVAEGMTAVCAGRNVTKKDLTLVQDICSSFGKSEVVKEDLMDVVTAVSGSSPAYVFLFIEAMADAAVLGGMPREQAYRFAAQAVLGSAKMVLGTGKHPGQLKDMVCSPAGTTIEAVRVLEKEGMRSAVMEATKACLDVSRRM